MPTFEPVQIRGHLGESVYVHQMSREQVLEEMRRALDLGIVSPDVRVVAEAGDTSTTIVNHALSNGTDLIVMGTHGRRGFKRLLLGSVTESVLREAPCPF